jgi:hypothetical protein
MTQRLLLRTAILFVTALLVQPSQSQDSSSTHAGTGEALSHDPGIIAGHEFIPSTFIREPFVRTYLKTWFGFGSTMNSVYPTFTIAGKTFPGQSGSLLFAVMNAEYQHTIRSWLAVRGRFGVIGRLADETPSLVAQGITLMSGFEFGWLIKLTESERYMVSGSLGIKNTSTTDVYLQRFVEGIIEAGELLPGNKLVLTTPTLRGTAGVQAACVISNLTGVTLTGNLDYGESLDRGEPDRWYYALSAAFDFNLHSENGVPIGFVVGGGTGSAVDYLGDQNRSSQSIFGRIAYTGSRDFALGLDLGYQFIPIRDLPEKQEFLSAVVDIRLYF